MFGSRSGSIPQRQLNITRRRQDGARDSLTLSPRMVEEMLAAHGIELTYETVRCWATKFGLAIAKRIRSTAPGRGDKWHLDEVTVTIKGQDQGNARRGAERSADPDRANQGADPRTVEHPFHVVKNLFRHRKVRCKGQAENTAQLFSLFALANLVIAKNRLHSIHGESPSCI